MDRLVAQSPFAGLLPRSVGTVRMSGAGFVPMGLVLPYAAGDPAFAAAFAAATGSDWPAPNCWTEAAGRRVVWFGVDQALVIGSMPNAGLAGTAAVVDQSDAWAVLTISGDGTPEVLARLVPVDLRLPKGAALRTLIGHIHGCILVRGGGAFDIMVPRSMAGTLVDALETAARGVMARRHP